jgi:hypothetical protein
VGIWLLFLPLLALMLIHAKGTQMLGREQREIRDRLSRIETQLYILAVAMDSTHEKLGEVITEHVRNEVIKAQDEAAEAAELADVITADESYTIKDEAA